MVNSEYVISADCYQFDDYSKYAASNFNEEIQQKKVRKERTSDRQPKTHSKWGKKISI